MPELTLRPDAEAAMDAMAAAHAVQSERCRELLAAHPRLQYLTALIIAGDQIAAENAYLDLAAGKSTYDEALTRAGSFTRLDLAARAQEAGYTSRETLLASLPDLWRSDIDPTRPVIRFLPLWIEAFNRNGNTVLDGPNLPHLPVLNVYRGQDPTMPPGLSWTLSRSMAESFARGKALRAGDLSGVVLSGRLHRRYALAYLTARGEAEIIAPPARVQIVKIAPVRPKAAHV